MSENTSRQRTSAEWWAEVRVDEARFNDWLRKQYHGEITAAERVRKFCDEHAPPGNRWRLALLLIATQELKHAAWVGELLLNRGIEPALLPDKPERYWSKALANVSGFTGLAAQAAWAERMRLERIKVIAADTEASADVRQVFEWVRTDEEFHAKAFADMAGDEAMTEALNRHQQGMRAIDVATESESELIPEAGFVE